MGAALNNLLVRIFLHYKSSLESLAFVIVTWLSSNGFDLSEPNKAKVAAWLSMLAYSTWRLFSKDPMPQPEAGAGK